MERAVLRRSRFCDQRARESQSALGSQTISRPQTLAPLGLSERSGFTAIPGALPVVRPVSHGELAGLSHLGSVRNFTLGVRPFLETARWDRQTPPGIQSGLGQLAAARVQSRLH